MTYPTHLDHLVYAAPDLDHAVSALEAQLGVRAVPGGSHPGLGTRNALIALGSLSYLEIIAPDPEQPEPAGSRPFAIDELAAPRLVTWAVKESDLEARVAAARDAGYDPGVVLPMSRQLPDGSRLQWRLTIRQEVGGDGLVPFLIDWGETPSPASSAARGCSLDELRAEHPRPDTIAPMLAALDVELALEQGPRPALIAAIACPRGKLELR